MADRCCSCGASECGLLTVSEGAGEERWWTGWWQRLVRPVRAYEEAGSTGAWQRERDMAVH